VEETCDTLLRSVKADEPTILLGDFNACDGNDVWKGVIGNCSTWVILTEMITEKFRNCVATTHCALLSNTKDLDNCT